MRGNPFNIKFLSRWREVRNQWWKITPIYARIWIVFVFGCLCITPSSYDAGKEYLRFLNKIPLIMMNHIDSKGIPSALGQWEYPYYLYGFDQVSIRKN